MVLSKSNAQSKLQSGSLLPSETVLNPMQYEAKGVGTNEFIAAVVTIGLARPADLRKIHIIKLLILTHIEDSLHTCMEGMIDERSFRVVYKVKELIGSFLCPSKNQFNRGVNASARGP